MNRREFLRGTAWMGAAALAGGCMLDRSIYGNAANGAPMQGFRTKPMSRIRLAVVGCGKRGNVAMPRLAVLPGVEIVALCDLHQERIDYQQKFLRDHGYPAAKYEFAGPEGYKKICQLDIDLVYNTTNWQMHAPVALEAMENGKHVLTEVPAVTTVEDAWAMVETAERTRRHCMMLENCCYGEAELLYLNLIRKGMIGELVHAEAGYMHDLRVENYNDPNIADPSWENDAGYIDYWRFKHNAAHKGNQYPTHGLGPVCQMLGINRGDRFDYLVSLESNPASNLAYAKEAFGTGWKAETPVAMGDMNSTLIKTAKGRSILLQHDVSSPRPYTRHNRITGTKGILEGISFVCDETGDGYATKGNPVRFGWETKNGAGVHLFFEPAKVEKLRQEYMHPYAKTALAIAKKVGGHGGMDFMMDLRWAYCLQNGLPLDQDVYDLASWSAITELSERSVRNRSASVDVPDFTRGGWKNAAPLGIVDVDVKKLDFEKVNRLKSAGGGMSV